MMAGRPNQERARAYESGDWAVIAATYKSFSAAQRRARTLNAAYPECACSVYPRENEGANYYVVVGSNLSRSAADSARERAVEAGLPADTYVTKLNDQRASSPSSSAAPAQ